MVPMVFVVKESGEVHLCVDNHELNKMIKDEYSHSQTKSSVVIGRCQFIQMIRKRLPFAMG